ncbi:PLAC8 family-domain-containing protein [Lyophyllum atratum]|nr:PLAC8 family-domain-containing protein [Lyophyllum atratum]
MATGGNRNVKNLPMEKDGREWSNGLFDCCNDGTTCLISWCFPCVVYGQNKKRLEHLQSNGTPDPEQGGCMSSDCFLHGCITTFCGCGFLLQMGTRGTMRNRYDIKGGSCGDCCTSLCCMPCALTQEAQELALEEQSFGGVPMNVHQKA